MAEPKIKPAKREAGKSKFRLPERPPRPVEENPLRELLKEARAQEAALAPKEPPTHQDTPAKKIAGVRTSPSGQVNNTPAMLNAGVSPADAASSTGEALAVTFAEFSR